MAPGSVPSAALGAGSSILWPPLLTAGDGAVAGIGAAAAWVGAPGEPLDERVVLDMARFLSASSPRIRVMGGARFDARQTPDADWAPFGSFYFTIPQCAPLPPPPLRSLRLAWYGEKGGVWVGAC